MNINSIDYNNTLFVHHHLGLGDHIINNGMVRYILEKIPTEKLLLVVKNRNYDCVKQMYRDCQKIDFIRVDVDNDFYNMSFDWSRVKLIRAGFENTREDWDISFYDSLNIPFNERWDSYYYERDLEVENSLISIINPPEKFILVHDEASNAKFDLRISTDLPLIKVRPVENFDIFSWLGLLERAEEVHCIDSSFVHIAQMIKVKKGFFHNVRSVMGLSWGDFSRRENWGTVDYK
jgi:hypothetical protein